MLKSSQKVFDVLEYLCMHGAAPAAEISTALQLQKTSVHRFLNTLVEMGYVSKEELTTRFCPTLKILQLGLAVSARTDVLAEGRRILRELARSLQVTANLATLMNGKVLVLHREYPENMLTRIMFNQELPAYSSASGKALLTCLSDSALEQYLAQTSFTAFTSRTITHPDALREEISKAKSRGYTEENGESVDSVYCVAVPASRPGDPRLWAISVSMEEKHMRDVGLPILVDALRLAARGLAGTPH